jgi:hypothetical protein
MALNAFKQSQVLRLVLNYCGATGNSSSSCNSSASSQLLACWTALNRQTNQTASATQASRGLRSQTNPRGSSAVSVLGGGSHHVVPTASFCNHGNSNLWGRRLLPHQLAATLQHRRWKHTPGQQAPNSSGDTSSQATTQQQRQMAPGFTVFQLHQELAGGR